jgi:hypothetical protein
VWPKHSPDRAHGGHRVDCSRVVHHIAFYTAELEFMHLGFRMRSTGKPTLQMSNIIGGSTLHVDGERPAKPRET